MNNLWLKIASAVIGILILIVVISMLMPGGDKEPSTEPPVVGSAPTNFSEQAEQDREGLTFNEDIEEYSMDNIESSDSNNVETPTPEVVQIDPVQPQPAQMTIYVKNLNEAERTAAEEQLNYAATSFSAGRLPGLSFKPSIDAARRIIERWPDSIYAYHAKLLLAKVPIRFQQQYNITSDELDTSSFSQPRAGTIPVPVTIEDR